MKTTLHPLYGLSIAVLAALLAGCGGKKSPGQQGPPPTQVTAYEVKTGNATYYDTYPATVTPLNQVDIRPEVSGYVTSIDFKDGQHVRKGQKLYSIDQQQYRAAFDQAQANLNVAKSNLARAEQDAARYKELASNDAVARQTLEHALADRQSAQMQVEAAEANAENVRSNLRYSTFYAPFNGTIGFSSVKLGSLVTAGQTVMNTISSDDPMAVDVEVDEKQIARFADLLHKGPEAADSIFTVVLPDGSLYPYPGVLSVMDRAVDPQTGTIRVRLTFPNPGNVLRAGLTCNLRVKNPTGANTILIPYKAVVEQMGEYSVFVVNANRASQRRITLGPQIRDMVVVKNGLQPGEQIVTEGIQRLRDNSPVAVNSGAPQQGNQLQPGQGSAQQPGQQSAQQSGQQSGQPSASAPQNTGKGVQGK